MTKVASNPCPTNVSITGQAVDKATGTPMAGVTVSAMNATSPGTELSTTTTDSSGNFTASVPSGQSVYLHLTTSGYVNKNTLIVSTTGSLAFSSINMFTTAQGVQIANGLGQCLSATSWTDPCIQNIGWANFGAKLTGGSNAAGVTISASPSGTTIGYNNGSGVYNGASTIASPGGLPAAAGYTSTQAHYAFTATNGSTTLGPVNMWLVKGELGGYTFSGF